MATQQVTMQETIIAHITRDHRKTDREIAELELRIRRRGEDAQDPVFVPMKQELFGHMAAEEKLLYPALEGELREQVTDARKEYDRIRRQLEELTAGGETPEAEWTRRLEILKQIIQHHVTDEESGILPAARRILDEQQLRELGSRFERMETEYT